MPTTYAPPAARSRLICPSPQPTSRICSKPDSSSSAIGRICSTYSGSAPSVNPSIHQSAWASHKSSVTGRRLRSPHEVLRLAQSRTPTRRGPRPRPHGRRRGLVRALVRRPLHAQHRQRDDPAGRRPRVLGDAARHRCGDRPHPDRPAGVADLGPSPGRARQSRRDHRPHLERPHGARHRRGLADQRTSRVRHRAAGTGAPRDPLRRSDPDHPLTAQ